MVQLTKEEKLRLMRSLNWDYLDKPEDMLAVAEGRLGSSGAFTFDSIAWIDKPDWQGFCGDIGWIVADMLKG